jgi:hypothetical protein
VLVLEAVAFSSLGMKFAHPGFATTNRPAGVAEPGCAVLGKTSWSGERVFLPGTCVANLGVRSRAQAAALALGGEHPRSLTSFT